MNQYLAIACAAAAASAARADILIFHAHLDGSQEVPPVVTTGTGFAEVTLDDVTGAVTVVTGSFSGLVSPTTAAHIHGMAPAGANAGVLIGLNIPIGVTAGGITGSGNLSAAQIPDMIAGLTYINIHSNQHPGGEIRGQLILIPAPAGAVLLGLGAFAAARRRR
jgi:hypothetical protein